MSRAPRPGPGTDAGFPALKARIIARTGHHYYVDKDDLLFDRLHKRFRAHSLSDSTAYARLLDDLTAGAAEWAALEAEITIGETFFFRYAEQFAALRETILPGLIAARAGERTLRIWSAGCSTGAEPYSLAILAHELLGDALPDWRIAITGTDISTAALETARAACYGRWALRTMPKPERLRYFVPGPAEPGPGREGTYALRPEFRRMVRFERRNLMGLVDGSAPPHAGEFDLILCRNVLIYFEAAVVLGIVRGLGRRLKPDGWLLIGHAEPNPDFAKTLAPVSLPGTVAYRPRGAPDFFEPPPPAPAPWQPELSWVTVPPESPAVPAPSAAAVPLPESVLPEPILPAPVLPEPAAGDVSEAPLLDLPAIRALADAGETASAWRALRAAIRLSPTEPALHYYDGLLAQNLGRAAEAERALRGALYLDRDFIMAHYQLGLLLAGLGRPAEGARSLDNAARLALALPAGTVVAEGDGIGPRELAESAALARAGLEGGGK